MPKSSVQFSAKGKGSAAIELSSADENIRQVRIAIKTEDTDNSIVLSSRETVEGLSDALRAIADKMVTSTGQASYKVTGKAVMVLSHNNKVLGKFINGEDCNETLFNGDVRYEDLCNAWNLRHPDNTDNNLVFVLYNLMDGSLSREAIETAILECIKYQAAFVASYNFHTCRIMRLQDIARESGDELIESTISRATANVLILTRKGNITLDSNNGAIDEPSLFDSGCVKEDGTVVSRYEVVERIREIIENEDRHHPYTDERIAAILNRENYRIARKTVNKYRESFLRIGNSNERRI